jgi:DMSO/TMAO reductase YedYZ molybdopterin-dependent catalytic subunit
MNGLALPRDRGFPFEVAAEAKWGYKWARWVNEIELSDDPNFRGYWESRGYNNNGDYPGPIFGKR